MGTIEKVISDLKAAGIEVVSLEDVYPMDGDRKLKNIDGIDIDTTGKMIMEIRCVVPIIRA